MSTPKHFISSYNFTQVCYERAIAYTSEIINCYEDSEGDENFINDCKDEIKSMRARLKSMRLKRLKGGE